MSGWRPAIGWCRTCPSAPVPAIRAVTFAAVVAVAALFVACDRSAAPTFAADDLPRILPHPDEAPDGTKAQLTLGGARDLDAFARDATERQALVGDGFVSAYVVYFPPESYFRQEPHAETDVAFQAIAGLFDDAEGASSSLARYVEDLRTRQMVDATDVSGQGLGDQAFGLTGAAASDGSFLRVYAWRTSNLILVLVASGPVAADTALDLARTIDTRAG
jgi:hypothetical protein